MLRTLGRLTRRHLGTRVASVHTATAPIHRRTAIATTTAPTTPTQWSSSILLQPPLRCKSAHSSADAGGDELDAAGVAGLDTLESLEEDIEVLHTADEELAVDDALLAELIQYTAIEQIFTFIDGNFAELNKQQVIRCVLILWDHYKPGHLATGSQRPAAQPLDLDSATCERLLERVRTLAVEMTPDELTICLLYLGKLGWVNRHPALQHLLDVCVERLKDDQIHFPLTALSRFAVALNAFKEIYTFFVCQDAFARMLQHLDTITNCEDLRLLTIGLNTLHQLVSIETMDTYKARVQLLLDNGTLNGDKVKCLLKLIQFLNYPHWSQRNTRLLRELVLTMRDRIETLQVNELEQIFRVFQSQLEPAELTAKLTRHAQTLFEQTPTAELLACSVMYALPDKRTKLTEYAKEFIYSREATTPAAPLSTLFKILRYLKISNVHTCDGYWSKVMHEIRTNEAERQSYVLARHCHRYMHFNNNLGGTYHHKEFEKYVTGLLVEEMRTGITAYIPSKFAKVAAFIIAYGHTPNSRQMLPEFVVCRIEDMARQFKIMDCLQISRGIQIALQMRFKKHISPELADQLLRIELVLNSCTERHLEQPNLTLSQLNSILRAYNNRQTSTRTPLFHQIMHKYTEIPSQLNSRAIREITFNLNASKYMMPSVCASVVQYVIDNRDYVMGDTVEKVLYCCYNLGYMPEGDAVLDAALHIINRDFDYMSGLSIVQACLAINFYRALPEALVNRVFNIGFIKRLEDEIEMCYSKATYPERVLNQVMQLNRAVCLDCPAAGVPWFQQNYIEAQMSKLPVVKNKFHDDIRSMLVAYLKDQQLLKLDHVTPYGYRIDFVLYFDKHRKPVAPPPSDDVAMNDSIDKVAILLLKIDSFCQNDLSQLRGPDILRERHLEMLGYKVVQVNQNEWNSMYMSVPGARMSYLKGLLEVE